MKNIDKLHRLYAKTPGPLLYTAIHGYTYLCQQSGEIREGTLKAVDFEIYMMIYLNSDMRSVSRGGTNLSHPFSAKDLSDASRKSKTAKPRWGIRTVQYSLRRLKDAGFLREHQEANRKETVRLFDPFVLPSRRKQAEKAVSSKDPQ